MGYSDTQRHELEATIKRVPCDLVVVATPIDLARTIKLEKPNVCVHYEVEELGKPTIGRLDRAVHRNIQTRIGRRREVVMPIKDFLSIRDFTPLEIRHFLHVAVQVKTHPDAYRMALKGKTLAMIFEKPSLRTRVTFDVGMEQLGGHPLYLSPAEISLGKRESVHDVAKNLERMVQGIMIRTFAHEIVVEMATPCRHPGHQWPDRLQPSLPGYGGLHDDAGSERPGRGAEDSLYRRWQ